MQWSPDGRQLASGGNDNLLLVWQMGSSSPVMRFTEHQVRECVGAGVSIGAGMGAGMGLGLGLGAGMQSKRT